MCQIARNTLFDDKQEKEKKERKTDISVPSKRINSRLSWLEKRHNSNERIYVRRRSFAWLLERVNQISARKTAGEVQALVLDGIEDSKGSRIPKIKRFDVENGTPKRIVSVSLAT